MIETCQTEADIGPLYSFVSIYSPLLDAWRGEVPPGSMSLCVVHRELDHPVVLRPRAREKGKQVRSQASNLNQEQRVDIEHDETAQSAALNTRARRQSLNEEDTSEQAASEAAGRPWRRGSAGWQYRARRIEGMVRASRSPASLGTVACSVHFRGCVNNENTSNSLESFDARCLVMLSRYERL